MILVITHPINEVNKTVGNGEEVAGDSVNHRNTVTTRGTFLTQFPVVIISKHTVKELHTTKIMFLCLTLC